MSFSFIICIVLLMCIVIYRDETGPNSKDITIYPMHQREITEGEQWGTGKSKQEGYVMWMS